MEYFFAFCAGLSSLSMVASLATGTFFGSLGFSSQTHMILGLGSAIFASLLHCLVFAIFTGSGKDARLLVERLGLNAEYAMTVKKFRKIIFPPALKSIGWLLVLVILGGGLGAGKISGWFGWAHLVVAWVAVLYNLAIFWKEFNIIKENTAFIRRVNMDASKVFERTPALPETSAEDLTENEFATHVRAMGRFLCFLAYNLWLPYLYLRFSMAFLWVRWEPVLLMSLALYILGKYLQFKYGKETATYTS